MDFSQSGHRKQEDTREDSAIMLFGKEIKNFSNPEKIKEELSPRGVDEKGLSFATSSDDEEDLNPASENSMHVTPISSVSASDTSREHARKRKAIESGRTGGDVDDADKPKSIAGSEPAIVRAGTVGHAAEQLRSSIWSQCPRCNSADTKFCYFNNYNVNQPRHFCKHCQRYWTAGGTLRNVPIGAGKRKNKHILHKAGFVTSPSSTYSIPTPSLPLSVTDTNALTVVKSEPLLTPETAAFSVIEADHVNTNLELSTHKRFTDSVMPSLSPRNIIQPHSAQELITHQLQDNQQSRLSQFNPHSHKCSTNYGQIYSNLAYGKTSLSPIYPDLPSNLACEQSSLSQGHLASEALHQINPLVHNGSYGLSQINPHLRGGYPELTQICPQLHSGCSEFARSGTHLQKGLCSLGLTCPHVVANGSCKTSQECVDCKSKELSGLTKSERGICEGDEVNRNVGSEKKILSLDRRLPDMVRVVSEKQNKPRYVQIVHPKMGPNEVATCVQRHDENSAIVSGALNECKADMRESHHGTMDIKAVDNAQTLSATSTLVAKSEGASNIENAMTRGPTEGQQSMVNIWGSLWPCFYNMFWLDPLAFSHAKPVLTPQGWALPFVPPTAPKVEPTSHSHHSITSPIANMSKNLDPSSTVTALNTTTTLLPPFKDACNSACVAQTSSPGKCSMQAPATNSRQCQ